MGIFDSNVQCHNTKYSNHSRNRLLINLKEICKSIWLFRKLGSHMHEIWSWCLSYPKHYSIQVGKHGWSYSSLKIYSKSNSLGFQHIIWMAVVGYNWLNSDNVWTTNALLLVLLAIWNLILERQIYTYLWYLRESSCFTNKFLPISEWWPSMRNNCSWALRIKWYKSLWIYGWCGFFACYSFHYFWQKRLRSWMDIIL